MAVILQKTEVMFLTITFMTCTTHKKMKHLTNSRVTRWRQPSYILKRARCEDDPDAYLPDRQITELEINEIIKHLKLRKVCCTEEVQNEHIRYGSMKIVKCLALLFNRIIQKSVILRKHLKYSSYQ